MLEDLVAAIKLKIKADLFFLDHFPEEKALRDIIEYTIEHETIKLERSIDKASKADEIAEAKFVIGMVKGFRISWPSVYCDRLNFWDDAYTAALYVVNGKGWVGDNERKSISNAYEKGMTL